MRVSSVRLEDLTSSEARQLVDRGGIIIVPVGALEQHGAHLPLKTDFALALEISTRAAEILASRDIPIAVAPALWTGYSPHHMAFPGTVTLSATTMLAVLSDVCASLWQHGFRKILILNGHGGNTNLIGTAAQSLRFEKQVRVAVANYWAFALEELRAWRESELGGINHAGEMEMSLMLHAFPGLCRPDRARDSRRVSQSRFFSPDLLSSAPVATPWDFAELSDDGTIGSPEQASPERGEVLMNAIVARVTDFLDEMSGWDWSNPRGVADGGST